VKRSAVLAEARRCASCPHWLAHEATFQRLIYGVVAHAAVVKSSSDFTRGCCASTAPTAQAAPTSPRASHPHHRERRLPPCRRALLEFSQVRGMKHKNFVL
jgi:hypothetical protein